MRIVAILALSCVGVSAADITGTWKGVQTPSGTAERTFIFKQDGPTVTGETSSKMMGATPIQEGKLENDVITFTISTKFMGREVKLFFQGKFAGDELKINMRNDNGALSVDFLAKKI